MGRKHRRRGKPIEPKTRGGEMLLEWMRKTGTSQAELAKRVGVAQRTVGRWIDVRPPHVDDAALLQAETGVPVAAWAVPVRREPLLASA